MEAEETNSQPHARPRTGEGFIFSSRDSEGAEGSGSSGGHGGQREERERPLDDDRRSGFDDNSPADNTRDEDGALKSWEDPDKPWKR